MINETDIVFKYTQEQAIEDGFLIENPKSNRFEECNTITTNLFNKLDEIENQRNLVRVFPYDPLDFMGCLMLAANKIFSEKNFKDDQDENFFTTPKTEEGLVVWFVRNETGKLTAMLPGNY